MRDTARASACKAAESIAQLLWEQFGDEAARYAAGRLAAVPDGEGRRQWRAVLERLSELIAGVGMRGPEDRACC